MSSSLPFLFVKKVEKKRKTNLPSLPSFYLVLMTWEWDFFFHRVLYVNYSTIVYWFAIRCAIKFMNECNDQFIIKWLNQPHKYPTITSFVFNYILACHIFLNYVQLHFFMMHKVQKLRVEGCFSVHGWGTCTFMKGQLILRGTTGLEKEHILPCRWQLISGTSLPILAGQYIIWEFYF